MTKAISVALAVLMLLPALSASTKKKQIKQAEKELRAAALYLGNYSAHPPIFTTASADAAYVVRGEEDISIVEEALQFYRNGAAGIDVVERALRQLQRDLEDIPPAKVQSGLDGDKA